MIRLLSSLSLVLILAVGGPVLAEPSAPLPDIHVGDIWNYRNVDGFDGTVTLEFTHKVVDVSNDEITLKIGNKNVKQTNIQYFTKELNSLDVTSDQYKPFFPKYDFPLTVGKTWNRDFKATKPSGSNYSGIVHAKVVAVEDVTVPAGTFSCFRIVYEIEAFTADSTANATKGNLTIWYAPAVNNAVKSETVRSENGRVRGKEVTELVTYISPTAKPQ
jgi:hypothetical protein